MVFEIAFASEADWVCPDGDLFVSRTKRLYYAYAYIQKSARLVYGFQGLQGGIRAMQRPKPTGTVFDLYCFSVLHASCEYTSDAAKAQSQSTGRNLFMGKYIKA